MGRENSSEQGKKLKRKREKKHANQLSMVLREIRGKDRLVSTKDKRHAPNQS